MRSFGPWRSAITAIGLRTSSCTSRTIRTSSACSACAPCEKLSRAQSIPARTSVESCSCDEEAGPSVAMIFVRRGGSIGDPDHAAVRSFHKSLFFQEIEVSADGGLRHAQLSRQRIQIAHATLGEQLAQPGFAGGHDHVSAFFRSRRRQRRRI